jgi:dTDP-glucose 4,6-dehydratase
VKVLVTGGAGFLGSHYVRSVLSGEYEGLADAEVVVLDRLTYAGHMANLEPVIASDRLTFVHGDICDARLVDSVLAGIDEVVHFAAESHVDRSIVSSSEFVRTNVVGTQTLLHASLERGVGRFVHVSTDEVYGSVETGSWTEDEPLAPSSPYAASKAGSDLLALAFHRTHGLDVTVTRGSNTYGPYQQPEKAVPLFVTNLLSGDPVPLYGDGTNRREWLHVDDHCRGIELVRAGGEAGRVYHVGGGTELTNRELVERLLTLCGADRDRVRYVADRPGHDRRYSLAWSRIRDELGYEPRVDLDDGLAETVRWYRENLDWWESLRVWRE